LVAGLALFALATRKDAEKNKSSASKTK
jgi:hypothetical protein